MKEIRNQVECTPSTYFEEFRIGYPTEYLSKYRLQNTFRAIPYGVLDRIPYRMPERNTLYQNALQKTADVI